MRHSAAIGLASQVVRQQGSGQAGFALVAQANGVHQGEHGVERLILARRTGYAFKQRLDRLAHGHERGLERLRRSLAEAPKRAIDVFSALFARPIGSTGDLLGMATGESLAHLNCLLALGEVVVEPDADGVRWYRLRPN